MDSGHSGSLQSSSGADDEHTSRTPTPTPNSLSSLFPHHPPPLFDPLSDFFNDPKSNNPLMFNPFSRAPDATTTATEPATAQTATSATARNPRKRSRASRRAPTTVLTTDTTNFRAMVQEFTGIPSPPFVSSPFIRAKLDLFGAPSSTGSPSRPFLLRPTNFHNQSPGLVNLRNDPVLTFQSLLNQGNSSNVQNYVPTEGNLGISQERGPSSLNVMVTNQMFNDY